ncbi:hypothetical protein V5E97_31125 [Singulisphaera sp. Ch08]|uniref:Uncharacterized protein n=1 Tax=Singulisphaera sp. Ch08 TaxID=3120278 RepID=A0AAU7CC51_9BACT
MQRPRSRMTIRWMMLLVVLVASVLSFWAYLDRWERRRVVMYQQQGVTRSIMLVAEEDFAAAGHTRSQFRQVGTSKAYTDHWTERLEAWGSRDGRDVLLLRAVVSGANGRFRAPPISVEIDGFPFESPWLDRLLRAYRTKGWQYRVVRRSNL